MSIFKHEDKVGATPQEWQSNKMEGAWVLTHPLHVSNVSGSGGLTAPLHSTEHGKEGSGRQNHLHWVTQPVSGQATGQALVMDS